MNLQLTRPLLVFDLETTGINAAKDRIIEICLIKLNPNSSRETKTWRVNPEMPIPPDSTAVHGITNEDLKDAPTFKTIAPEVMAFMKGTDLAGFNSNKFDIPLLAEELLRAGIDFDLSNIRTVDAQVIFFKKEPRNLAAAYQFYCQKNLTDAHSAEADALATLEILDAQLGHYDDLPKDIAALSEFSSFGKTADLAGFVAFDEEKQEIFTFGKYKGKRVRDIFQKDTGYYGWLQNADFPLYTKKVLTAIQLKSKF